MCRQVDNLYVNLNEPLWYRMTFQYSLLIDPSSVLIPLITLVPNLYTTVVSVELPLLIVSPKECSNGRNITTSTFFTQRISQCILPSGEKLKLMIGSCKIFFQYNFLLFYQPPSVMAKQLLLFSLEVIPILA